MKPRIHKCQLSRLVFKVYDCQWSVDIFGRKCKKSKDVVQQCNFKKFFPFILFIISFSMLSRLVCGDEGVLRADQPGPLLGVEGVWLLGAHQPGPLGGQACLLRGAPTAVHDDLSNVLL